MLDTQKHFIKDWPTWNFGGLFLHKHIYHFNTLFQRQFFEFGQLIGNASDLPILGIGTFARIDEELSGVIHKVALANEEPRPAWRILSDWGFRGGNAEQTALRADPFFSPILDFKNLRCILDEVRMYFDHNPDEID